MSESTYESPIELADTPAGIVTHEPSPITLHLISLSGWLLFAVWGATLVIWGVIQPDPYAQGWRLVAELAVLGHVVNVADGISNGFSKGYLLVQSGLQDIILVLILYPWVVRGYQGMETRGWVGKSIENFRKSAERHQKYVEPFGAIGLWVFVFFPFWSTGALIGAVIGYLIGLRTWVNFLSVLTGHALAVVSTIWFFDFVHAWVEGFSRAAVQYLPWAVGGGIVLAWIGNQAYKRLRRARAAE